MSDDVTPLNEILKPSSAPVEAKAEPAQVVPEPAPVEAVPEPVKEATPTVAKIEPQEDVGKQVEAFKKKAIDESRKRQAAEEKLNQYQTQVEKPDAMIDPESAISFQVNQVRQEFQSKFLDLSENNAKSRHSDDFEAMKVHFFEQMLPDNPILQQQALQQSDPYGWIYNQAKNHTEIAKIGNVTEWQAQKEAEIRAKIEAEYAGKLKIQTEAAITKAIPGSLGKSTAVGGNKPQNWEGPTPLKKVLGK